MHLLMILVTLAIAYLLRYLGVNWKRELALVYFLLPPLLLLTTGIAIVSMGPDGKMLGLKAGWFSYLLAWGYLVLVMGLLLKLAYQAWRQREQMTRYSQIWLGKQPVYLLEIDFPYCAQVGFWRSHILISRGLLNLLEPEELKAVLLHEQAHQWYHDNFWFFWLSWLRHSTSWLPQGERLWQELLLWRELRADAWGAQQLGGLAIASSLVKVAYKVNSYKPELSFSVELNDGDSERLEQRIAALLSETPAPGQLRWYLGIIPSLLPILTIWLHH